LIANDFAVEKKIMSGLLSLKKVFENESLSAPFTQSSENRYAHYIYSIKTYYYTWWGALFRSERGTFNLSEKSEFCEGFQQSSIFFESQKKIKSISQLNANETW
jgi:hypothetical protein